MALLLFGFLGITKSVVSKEKPLGPVQPSKGPGGKEYNHKSFFKSEFGLQENKYFVFTPNRPVPRKAGLLIFLHDWFATSPDFYIAWIRHLTRKGWVVVFPKYQGTGEIEKNFFFHAVRSVKDALLKIFQQGKYEVDREKVAVIGHGAGAIIGANIAATSHYFGIPSPGVVYLSMPKRMKLPLYDLSGIKPETKMLVIIGDRVSEDVEYDARELFYAADRVRTKNKNYVTFLSDFYGKYPVVADRNSTLAPERAIYCKEIVERKYEFVKLSRDRFHAHTIRIHHLDAIDWMGNFRLFDALSDHAFYGKSSIQCLGNTPEQRFMGYWSDGRKLRGLISTYRP